MNTPLPQKTGFSLQQLLLAAVGTMLLTALVLAVIVKVWLFPQPFTPVRLDQQEEQALEEKLERLAELSPPANDSPLSQERQEDRTLQPEPYTEEGANREISLTEREANSFFTKNTDMADKLAIDFSKDLVSLRLLLPLDPDLPLVGGTTLRIRTGVELAWRNQRPVLILKGVSLMGVPLPNAWLGDMKNIDLMHAFGGEPGLWQSLGAGLESVSVQEGKLTLKLRE